MALPDRQRLVAHLRRWLTTDLVVADVGARWGVDDRWAEFGPSVEVIGFEPDEEECRRLTEAAAGRRVSFVPAALGPEAGQAELHVTAEPACSSVYEPLPALIRQRPLLSCTAPVSVRQVPMTTLDLWAADSGTSHVDVIKLDTQGSELGVLEGATETLKTVRMTEIEVEFNEIYAGQPLFGDVDRFLRGHGFVLWRLQQLAHYGMAGAPPGEVDIADIQYSDTCVTPVAGHGGQLYWAHAYFVPAEVAFVTEAPVPWPQAVRDACAATAFGFVDLACSVLSRAASGAPAEARIELAGLLGHEVTGGTGGP